MSEGKKHKPISAYMVVDFTCAGCGATFSFKSDDIVKDVYNITDFTTLYCTRCGHRAEIEEVD